jgi:hypothetical protein
MLNFIGEHYPDRVGLLNYLFILGELVDAWHNRFITHKQQAIMVLQAHYFFTAWAKHIDTHPKHSHTANFISCESYDIFITICNSLLALIFIHWQFYPTYPLLPWMHSTEPSEHVFSVIRKLKPDFNFADFLFLWQKIMLLLQGDFNNTSPQEKSNRTAEGYHHTYFNSKDINLTNLTQWCSDVDFEDAVWVVFVEAGALLSTAGISILALFSDNGALSVMLQLVRSANDHLQADAIAISDSDDNLYFNSNSEDDSEDNLS